MTMGNQVILSETLNIMGFKILFGYNKMEQKKKKLPVNEPNTNCIISKP